MIGRFQNTTKTLNQSEKEIRAVPSMQDVTSSLQTLITDACKNLPANDQSIASLELQKGDYAVTGLQVPRNGKILLFSKGRVRLLFIGKRNRPMFILDENSILAIREKIELYYNTNNVQEVSKLIIKRSKSSQVDISKEVKVSLFSMKQGD
jgi:hypothetical protein